MARTLSFSCFLVLISAAAAACGNTLKGAGDHTNGGSASQGGAGASDAGGGVGGLAGALGEAGASTAGAGDMSASGAGGASEVCVSGLSGSPAAGPRPYRALQVVTGTLHTCALLENHGVKCWGKSGHGGIGLGLSGDEEVGLEPGQMGDALPFVDLGSGRTAKSIAAARYSTCAILDDDSVKCWGLDVLVGGGEDIAIGDAPGEMGDALAPVPLGPGRTARAVGMGFHDSCVAKDDGNYWCGGSTHPPSNSPGVPELKLVSMTGSTRALALYEDGTVRTIVPGQMAPLRVVASGVVAVAGSDRFECIAFDDGRLSCTPDIEIHEPRPELSDIKGLGVSNFHGRVCALHCNGSVWCWGGGWDQPWAPPASDSVVVPLPQPAIQLTSGADEHQCALLQDGSVRCWSWYPYAVPGVGSSPRGAPFAPVDLGTFEG